MNWFKRKKQPLVLKQSKAYQKRLRFVLIHSFKIQDPAERYAYLVWAGNVPEHSGMRSTILRWVNNFLHGQPLSIRTVTSWKPWPLPSPKLRDTKFRGNKMNWFWTALSVTGTVSLTVILWTLSLLALLVLQNSKWVNLMILLGILTSSMGTYYLLEMIFSYNIKTNGFF